MNNDDIEMEGSAPGAKLFFELFEFGANWPCRQY